MMRRDILFVPVMISTWLVAALLFAQEGTPVPAEKPFLTLRSELTIQEFIRKLDQHGWGTLRFEDEKPEAKCISIDVKDSGYCRALDEICRRHGNATYFHPTYNGLHTPEFWIESAPWIDYPTSYHGHFKVIVSHLLNTRRRNGDGEREWTNIRLLLFGPPWQRINSAGSSRPNWKMETVLAADGRELLMAENRGEWRSMYEVSGEPDDDGGNLLGHSLAVKSPGAERAFKLIRGRADVEISEVAVARLALRPGEKTDLGTLELRILAVDELEKGWEVRCVAERKPALGRQFISDILDGGVRAQSDMTWHRYSLEDRRAMKESAFEVTIAAEDRPEWIEFRYLRLPRRVEVPFALENVRFDK